jgi:ribosomal protein S18
VGEGPELRALPQFRRDLMLAKAYAHGIRPKRPESMVVWNTLKCFEARLYELRIGAPNHPMDDARCRSIEYEALQKIIDLAKFVTANGRLHTDEPSVLSFGDQRVVSYAFKTARVHPSNPPRIGLRPGVQSIACRRAVLVSLCKDMEFQSMGRDSTNDLGQAVMAR